MAAEQPAAYVIDCAHYTVDGMEEDKLETLLASWRTRYFVLTLHD